MEIVVCIKQVPDDSVEIHLDPGTMQPAIDKVTPVVNAFDTYALEMATRYKEAVGGEITVLSVGPDAAKDGLKNCLAVGASHAYVVTDAALDGADTLGTAEILHRAIEKIEADTGKKFDLVFCGKETTDVTSGQVGAQLAELMGVGVVQNIIDVEGDVGAIKTKQETEEGYLVVEAGTPCVLTATKPAYDPRYPTIKNKIAARKIPITAYAAGDLTGLDAEKCSEKGAYVKTVKLSEPPKKEAGVKIQEETVEDSTAKALELMAEAKVI